MKKYGILVFALVFLFLAGCYLLKTNEVKIEYAESNLYSKEDMDLAIKVINKRFEQFPNCKMTSIRYAGDEESKKELIDGYDECIVFYSSFHTGKYNTEALEPDMEYKDWAWILCRKKGGEWILVNNGYA